MKKFIGMLVLVALLGFTAGSVFAGSDINHWYLYPDADGVNNLYPEGIAKLTFNRATGDYMLRGHGLEAGQKFEVRSGGDLPEEPVAAVGNADAGLGNNVLIKGNIIEQGLTCNDLGARWNLWLIPMGGGNVRVLRTTQDDISPKDFCNYAD